MATRINISLTYDLDNNSLTEALHNILLAWMAYFSPNIADVNVGFILNLTVISLNGGLIPVSNTAHALGGYALHTGRFQNSMPITNSTI
jgi:hypothetical protein